MVDEPFAAGATAPHLGEMAPAATDRSRDEFDQFYRSEIGRLIGFAVMSGGSMAEAADAAQEAMLSAYLNWDKVNNPRAWARLVAQRTLMGQWREARRSTVVEQPASSMMRVEPSAEESVMDMPSNSEVFKRLRDLPPRQRTILAWIADGFTPAEIAQHLQLDASSVRSTLRHARQALKRFIDTDQ